MTEQEFITTDPTIYGLGNINLFVSSSISGSELVPIAPYRVLGLTIPFSSKNGLDVFNAIQQVNSFKFDFPDGPISLEVLTRQKRQGYFFIRTNEVILDEIPALGNLGLYRFENSEFVFEPYIGQSFYNSDFNPLINTTNEAKRNNVRRVVDRAANQAQPTNLDAILSGSAEFAQVQNCSYTKTGIVLSRYNGTKETSRGILGNDPALGLVRFKASIHPNDSDITTIKEIQLSDREIVNIYFDAKLTGSHPDKFLESFPVSGSFLYIEDETRIVKLPNTKVYSVDKNQVFTLNQFGGVTLVQ
jgi:hypothetical protein